VDIGGAGGRRAHGGEDQKRNKEEQKEDLRDSAKLRQSGICHEFLPSATGSINDWLPGFGPTVIVITSSGCKTRILVRDGAKETAPAVSQGFGQGCCSAVNPSD
jgi:hypothetical protein